MVFSLFNNLIVLIISFSVFSSKELVASSKISKSDFLYKALEIPSL